MKIIAAIIPVLLFTSCLNNDTEVDRLKQRILRLERRVDSMTGGGNKYAAGLEQAEQLNSGSTRPVPEFSRCQKITKKGTQCKRKAKSNGYCWQHGG